MQHITRAGAALAMLAAFAWPGAAAAAKSAAATKNAPPELIEWVAPWREGLALRYETESYDVSIDAEGKERSRTTAIETIRITAVREDGFVQAWSSADFRYEQLEGGSEQESIIRQALESLPELTLEAELDASGNFVRLGNLDQMIGALRPVLMEVFEQAFQSSTEAGGGLPDGEEGEAARVRARETAAGVAERLTRPDVMGAMLSRDVIAFNDTFGATLRAGVPLEVDVEIESPLGLGLVPARVTLLMRPGASGSDEATLDWTTRMDREKAAEMALSAAERMYGVAVSGEARSQVEADMSIIDIGHARFRRSTGVPLMMEFLRTVQAAGEQRIERRRMRLLDDAHGHAWPDDGEPRPAVAD